MITRGGALNALNRLNTLNSEEGEVEDRSTSEISDLKLATNFKGDKEKEQEEAGKAMMRCIRAEILDRLPPGNPEAERSRRELRWLNTWMGNDRIMAGTLRTNWVDAGRHITDLGGGDGTFLLKVLRRVRHGGEVIGNGDSLEANSHLPVARIVDRHALLAPDSRRGFSRLGWRVEVWAADVLDWVRTSPARAELVMANLFLHHFVEEQLRELFAGIACRADLFVALEPRRSRLARMFSRCVGLIGCGPVTRHDAVASVAAGFRGRELSRVWGQRPDWVVQEMPAGWFGHLFVARRGGADHRRIDGGERGHEKARKSTKR